MKNNKKYNEVIPVSSDVNSTYQVVPDNQSPYAPTQLLQTQIHTICGKEGQIGAINARLDNQAETDRRIQQTVQQLLNNVSQEKKQTIEQFGKIGAQISKLNAVMQTYVDKTSQIIQSQNTIMQGLTTITTQQQLASQKAKDVEIKIQTLSKNLTDEISKRLNVSSDLESRLSKIEKRSYFWYALGVGLVTVLTACAAIAQVLEMFKK